MLALKCAHSNNIPLFTKHLTPLYSVCFNSYMYSSFPVQLYLRNKEIERPGIEMQGGQVGTLAGKHKKKKIVLV